MNSRTKANGLSMFLAVTSAAVSIAIGSLMLVSHLPFQTDNEKLNQISSQLNLPENQWVAIDLLAAQCVCSRTLAEHLLARGPLPGLAEHVVIIGPDNELTARFESMSWPITTVSLEDAAARFGIHGAPSLVLINPERVIKYVGGYSPDRGIRVTYRDQEIWRSVQADKAVEPLPVLGCAVGRNIQRRIDPLGLKYELFNRKG